MHNLMPGYEPFHQENEVDLRGVPQIPDWLHRMLQKGIDPTGEQEEEARLAIERAKAEINRRDPRRRTGFHALPKRRPRDEEDDAC